MFRDELADSESFLTQVPAIPTNDKRTLCPQCHYVQQHVPSITFTPEDISLRTISMIDLCTMLGTLALHALK